MKVAVITYDVPHLKTQQLVQALVLDEALEIALYGLPFADRPARAPRFHHRPGMSAGGHPREVAAHNRLAYRPVAGTDEIDAGIDVAVVAGAGLLPAAFVERVPVVNGHPGLIPAVRGLDAFKWAIHDGMPLGVSLHLLDAGVDAGRHLMSLGTPVYAEDTLESLARRHYENEIMLLARFPRYLERPRDPLPGLVERPPRKRMPAETETRMIEGFADYVRRFAVAPEAVR